MPVDLDVHCALAGDFNAIGRAVDLSTGGLFLKTTAPIVVKERVTVEFMTPDTIDSIRVSGVVAWCRFHYRGSHSEKPFHAAGIKFINLPERYQSLIQDYTFKLLHDDNLMGSRGILQVMGDIRSLPPAERLKAYHILIKTETDH